MHLSRHFQEIAERFGSKIALQWEDGQLTYQHFFGRLFAFGSGLRAKGLGEGAKVALLLPDLADYLVADYGIMAAGLVRVPLDPRLSVAETLAQLKLAEVAAIITTAEHHERVARIRDAMPSLMIVASGKPLDGALDFEEIVAAGNTSARAAGDASDLAALNFSGGTTGRPKATMISHANLSVVMARVPQAFEVEEASIFLNVRPLWPIAQVIVMSHFERGAKVVLGGRFEAARFGDLLASSDATRTSLVPTQLVRLLDHVTQRDSRFDRLEAIYVGGSRLPPDVFDRALDLIGPKIGILYGLTEAPITTYLPPRELDVALPRRREIMASSGRVLEGYEVRLSQPGKTEATDIGPSGEVLVRGANVMQGYWKEPGLTADALKDGWLHTNDIGAFDSDGRLHIVGRLKDVIRTGASTVLPKEVEDVIARQAGIADVAVTGLPNTEWGEIVAAFVRLDDNASLSEAEIIARCGDELGKFKRPKRVFFVDEIPRSHYGKVLKPLLLRKAEEQETTG